MEKVWFEQYPEGVPREINADKYASIVALFDKSVEKYADRPAFTNMGATVTYRELQRQALAFAAWLQHETALQPGDRLAIQMPNLLQYPVVMLGALRAGLVVVNVNPLYTPREMRHQFLDSGARAVVILENFADKLEQVLPDTQIQYLVLTSVGDALPWLKRTVVNFVVRNVKKMVPGYNLPEAVKYRETLRVVPPEKFKPVEVNGEDAAFLQYTGGTTGVAKGAVLTHRNIIANMEQISAWISMLFRDGEEIVITALPLYHIFALTVNCLLFLKHGSLNVLVTNPRDLKAFIKDMKREPFRFITGVNTLFNALLNNEDFRNMDFSAMVLGVGGGMALQKDVIRRWNETTGKPLLEGYGLTESSPVVCFNPVTGGDQPGSIGMPLPSTDLKIIDENGAELGFDEPGEICVKGPQIMREYWNRPDETSITLQDGWLHTGDIGLVQPDGFVRIVDRKKDMILVSGFNVYPNEVEDAAALHPGILEACAVGVKDDASGEIVKLYVVRAPGANITEAEVTEHCRKELTGYKRPKLIEFRDELPKSNVGKTLRKPLRDEANNAAKK